MTTPHTMPERKEGRTSRVGWEKKIAQCNYKDVFKLILIEMKRPKDSTAGGLFLDELERGQERRRITLSPCVVTPVVFAAYSLCSLFSFSHALLLLFSRNGCNTEARGGISCFFCSNSR